MDSPNLRRSNRKTSAKKFKTPTRGSGNLSTPGSNKSTRAGEVASGSLDRKLKGVMEAEGESPPRKSKRVKNNASAFPAPKDSNITPSSVAVSKKSEKRKMDTQSTKKNKNERPGSISRASKKGKRLNTRSYRALFQASEEDATSPVVAAPVRIDEENSSKENATDGDVGMGYEGGNVLEEENQTSSGEAVNEDSECSTSGLHETSEMILGKDGLETGVNQPASLSEVQPHIPVDMCSQNNVVESSLVLKTREQPAGLAKYFTFHCNQSCLPALPSQLGSHIHLEEAKNAIQDSGSIGIHEDGSTLRRFEVTLSDETDSDDNTCVACNTPGILKYCDGKGCNRRYHHFCLDPPLECDSLGIWLCTICNKKRIHFGIYSVAKGVESLWDVKDGTQNGKQYFVKYKSLAHAHNRWVLESDLIGDTPGGPDLVSKFNKRNHKEKTIRWKQEWAEPHRLLKKRLLMSPKEADEFFNSLGDKFAYCNVEWLVKWKDLGYEHATWELETSPFLCTPEAEELKRSYDYRHEASREASDPAKTNRSLQVKQSPFHKLQRLPDGWPAGLDNDHLSCINQLREFWYKSQGAVFVDDQERVIKTILFTMSILPDVCRPFLIVSTSGSLSLWEAKFNRLAPSVNVVVYSGVKDVRRAIQDLEFYDKGGSVMLQVLLSHPDAILEDIETIECIGWEAIIVDECQNSRVSKYLEQLKRLSTDFRMVLLTSPLKDNIPEYINLLSFLNCGKEDMLPSVANGDLSDTASALAMLKARFMCYIAYQRKADSSKFLEYWVPARLSQVQLEIYCFTLLSNSSALRSHLKTDSVGVLRDILISLRKCCDHPYLVDPLLQSSLTKGHPVTDILDIGVHASGKLLLLDKMLKEIRNKGLRVVILFQSGGGGGNPMGDILDDFVRQRFGHESYERVERGLLMSKKQAAMNMFNDKTKGRFVFLIESRACLPSIKLSSVDAIIIYGSDWNPLNDLRVLQKISIESQSERVSVFRLYSSCTVEEKALVLAKQDIVLDNNIQSIMPSVSHSLLSWGASFLFSRLGEFEQHNFSSEDSNDDKLFMDKVYSEFLTKLSSKLEASTEVNNAVISKASLVGTSYSRNIAVIGEREGITVLDGDPPTFWGSLLVGRSPRWKYISEPLQRNRRKVQHMDEPAKTPTAETDDARKKRRKFTEIMSSSPKVLADENTDVVLPENSSLSSSSQKSLDATWQELEVEYQASRQKSLHAQLKPDLTMLCKVLEIPENVKCLADEFLDYILKHHQVTQEPKGILHAFNISLCWRAASLLKHKVDHRESLALAVKHLNYECNEELAGFVYDKLRILKKKFSHRAGETISQSQPTPLKNNISHQRETSTNLKNDVSIPNRAAFVRGNFGNGALQEGPSGDFRTEQTVLGQQELMPVTESCREQHLSRDELLNRIAEKRINLVDMVFSLREKNIHERQQQEISKLDMHREKEVIKMTGVCTLVLEHVRRSHIDPEIRNSKIKLIIEWFTMLRYAFSQHIRLQRHKLEALQSTIWSKERQLKENFLQEAKSGQLDQSFDCRIPLPSSNFVMEEFSYFCKQALDFHIDETASTNSQLSLDDTSMMEITLVRNVIPSEAISTGEVRNGPVEILIHSGGGPASEAVDLLESRISSRSDVTCLQSDIPLVARHSLSCSPANADSINKESSPDDHSTGHVEAENFAGPSLSQGGVASQHVSDVIMEDNANNDEIVASDPHLRLESPNLTALPSQATTPVSREVEAQTNLTNLSTQQSVEPSLHPPAEPESAGALPVAAARCLPPEMQPSSLMPNVPLERIRRDGWSQIDHQPGTAPGPSQPTQLFPGSSMMFNHPPVDDEPLKNELHRLRLYRDSLSKIHDQKKSQLRMECNQELEKIKKKYDSLIQEQDSAYLQQKKKLDDIYEKVLVNQSLAEDFRAKFIATSAAQGRAHSPPVRQRSQASQQVPARSLAVGSTASPVATPPAARPPPPTSFPSSRPRFQPPQVARQSSSSQVVRPPPSIAPSNLVRAMPSPFGQMPPPRGSYGVRNEQARAPAPHLQRSRVPPPYSVPPTNPQQFPARLGVASRTQIPPAIPVDITPSSSTAVPATTSIPSGSCPVLPAVPVPPNSHSVLPAISLPSSSRPVLSAISLPSSSNSASLTNIPDTSSCGASVPMDASVGSRHAGLSSTGMQQPDSESASLEAFLAASLGLNGIPRSGGSKGCWQSRFMRN